LAVPLLMALSVSVPVAEAGSKSGDSSPKRTGSVGSEGKRRTATQLVNAGDGAAEMSDLKVFDARVDAQLTTVLASRTTVRDGVASSVTKASFLDLMRWPEYWGATGDLAVLIPHRNTAGHDGFAEQVFRIENRSSKGQGLQLTLTPQEPDEDVWAEADPPVSLGSAEFNALWGRVYPRVRFTVTGPRAVVPGTLDTALAKVLDAPPGGPPVAVLPVYDFPALTTAKAAEADKQAGAEAERAENLAAMGTEEARREADAARSRGRALTEAAQAARYKAAHDGNYFLLTRKDDKIGIVGPHGEALVEEADAREWRTVPEHEKWLEVQRTLKADANDTQDHVVTDNTAAIRRYFAQPRPVSLQLVKEIIRHQPQRHTRMKIASGNDAGMRYSLDWRSEKLEIWDRKRKLSFPIDDPNNDGHWARALRQSGMGKVENMELIHKAS
jgi:hypothetical protein